MGQFVNMALILPSQGQARAWEFSGSLNSMPVDHYLMDCIFGAMLCSGQDSFICPELHYILQPGNNNLNISVNNMVDDKNYPIKATWYYYD